MIFLFSVFQWVLYSSAVASVLAGFIILIKILLGDRLGVRWHYGIWFLVLIRLMIPYAPQSSFSVFNLFDMVPSVSDFTVNNQTADFTDKLSLPAIKSHGTIVQGSALEENIPINDTSINRHDNHFKILTYANIAVILWVMGVLILGCLSLNNTLQFWRRIRILRSCKDEGILSLVERCRKQLGLTMNVPVIYTDLVKSPAVFGFIRPKLLLPAGIENLLGPDELQYILFHELAHIKRKDIVMNCIAAVFQVIHWFNPILWYSFYRMRQDGELACDALAMSCIDPHECKKYGQTVLHLIGSLSKNNHIYGMAGLIEGKSQIKRRITMIAKFKKGAYKWPLISILVLAVMSCILLTNAQGFELRDNDSTSLKASASLNTGESGTQDQKLTKSTESNDSPTGKSAGLNATGEKLVMIDPGHGGNDMGAVYPSVSMDANDKCLQEKDLNLEISLTLLDMLKKSGVKAELTRKGDYEVGLKERADLANRLNASLFVSIHQNAGPSSEESGTLTLFNPSIDDSQLYGISGEKAAGLIHAEMVSGLGTVDGGLRKVNNLVILKETRMPSLVAEVAYMTNESDRKSLMTEAFREKAARALHDGILKVLYEMK